MNLRPQLISLALVALASCDRWQTCEERADWRIEFSHAASDFIPEESGEGTLSRARDGTLMLAIHDPTQVQFGTLRVGGFALARISNDGMILGLTPTPDLVSQQFSFAYDAQGNIFVAAGGNEQELRAYGPELQLRWRVSLMQSQASSPVIAADAEGHVAIVSRGANGDVLNYFETNGDLGWLVPLVGVGSGLVFDAGGDVHAFTSNGNLSLRHVQFAPDGTSVTSNAIERLPRAFAPDASFVGADIGDPDFGPDVTVVARYAVDGTRRWERSFDERTLGEIAVTDTGDVLVPITRNAGGGISSYLLRLDGKTGDTRSEQRMCDDLVVIGGDKNHYFGIGRLGSPPTGIARFAL